MSLTLWELGDGVVVRAVSDTPCPTGTAMVLATDAAGLEGGALMLSASTSGWVTQSASFVGAPMLFDKGDALIGQVYANNANQHLATVPVDLVYPASARGEHRISINAMSNTSTDSGDYAHLAMLEWVNPPDAPVVLNMNPYLQDDPPQTQQGGGFVVQSRFQSSGGTLLFRVNLSAWSRTPNTLMDVRSRSTGSRWGTPACSRTRARRTWRWSPTTWSAPGSPPATRVRAGGRPERGDRPKRPRLAAGAGVPEGVLAPEDSRGYRPRMAAHPFRAAVEAGDHAAMVAQLAPDVVFHTPVSFRPVEGRDAVAQVLGAVMRVFSDFRYTDELSGADGTEVLVFEAMVGDREVQGIDLLRINGDGLIADFTVMVRPLSATLALRDAMGRELGLVPQASEAGQ